MTQDYLWALGRAVKNQLVGSKPKLYEDCTSALILQPFSIAILGADF